ncbi:MAG TPA: sigma 54-interacting transcriptional regulator [Polyangiaceae bacterium]|nr:sigma 54-interacting transcriptional regulator [Polyangiaceae bacterium]
MEVLLDTTQPIVSGRSPARHAPGGLGLVQVFPCSLTHPPTVVDLHHPVVVGRDPTCPLSIASASISRKHAELQPGSQGVNVRDLGSRNGTFVDGVKVNGSRVDAPIGSVLRLGGILFLVVQDCSRHRSVPRRLPSTTTHLGYDAIAGASLSRLWDRAADVAGQRVHSLIEGETGTGKELVARIIHNGRGPFVVFNCAAIPVPLFEAELFGHAPGAFTGAQRRRRGLFCQANHGTLFLDEVGEMPLEAQAKLLRALDTHRIRALGESEETKVDATIVAATNVDLLRACHAGRFREDLYFRLSARKLHVPPLHACRDSILLLATLFLEESARNASLTPEAAEALLLAPWRGNIRELNSIVKSAGFDAELSGRRGILPGDLFPPTEFALPPPAAVDRARSSVTPPPRKRGDQVTRQDIIAAMAIAHGQANKAAPALGMCRASFYNHCKRLGINLDELRPPNTRVPTR